MSRSVSLDSPKLHQTRSRGRWACWLALGLLLPASCTKERATTPGDGDGAGSFVATTDVAGVAVVTAADGRTLLEAEVHDTAGAPLANLDVRYLASTPYPLVGFTQSSSGEPAGTFLLVPATSLRAGATAEADPHQTAVFILNLLDPRRGRLYDPERDGFSPTRYTSLAEIRQVLGYETIAQVLDTTPGIEDLGVRTRSELADLMATALDYTSFDGYHSYPPDTIAYIEAHQFSRLALFSLNQHGSYRYRFFRNTVGEGTFMIPLGVAAPITIDAPANGAAFADPPQRQQVLAGRIPLPPDVVTADGGRVELWANGHLMAGALAVGGDGTGNGTTFSTIAPLQLALGENALRVVVCVSEANRGLESGLNGEAGEASVTVTYDEAPSGPTAPALTAFVHPSVFPCPTAQVPVDFHFADPDGDVVTAHELATWSFNGVPGSHDGLYTVAGNQNLACFTQTEADCGITLAYGGTRGGDWIRWEFYVVDAEGLESNHLVLLMNITGDCPDGLRSVGNAWTRDAVGAPHR